MVCLSIRRGQNRHQIGFLLFSLALLGLQWTGLLVLGFHPTPKLTPINLRSCTPTNRICNPLSAAYSSPTGRFNYDDDSDRQEAMSSSSSASKNTTGKNRNPLVSRAKNPLSLIGRMCRRFWARIQQVLYRIFGRDRWIAMQRFFRSITERHTIYVLECCEGKYYVGSTQNKKKRFYQHLVAGGGSVWTQRYRPKRVLKQYTRIPKKYALGLESKVTAETMLKYGVNNARGAMFCNLHEYTLRDLDSLTRFLGHYNDLNYRDVRTMLRQQLSTKSSSSASSSKPTSMMQVMNNTSNSTSLSPLQRQPNMAASSSSSSKEEGATAAVGSSKVEWNVEEFNMNARYLKDSNGFQSRGRQVNDRCFRCGRRGHWAKNCPF